jgi:alkanesulfonate monooxygenase SsuD/methylene tetrahydromethanopterin reductase-like flavin-dependent oxidoreductase (luciferase family)
MGVGAVAEEFEALSIPFNQRGKVTDESLQVMKALWTQEQAAHDGEIWRFSDVTFSPKPKSRRGIPLWVGGGCNVFVWRRAAVQGDGWHATGISQKEFSEGVRMVRLYANMAGRAASELTFSMRVNVDYGQPLPSAAEEKTLISSSDVRRMAEQLQEWADAGAQHLVLALNVDSVQKLRTEMRRISEEVLPLISKAEQEHF